MASLVSIGEVDVIPQDFVDWRYPKFGSIVDILSDGSSVDNQVLQSSAVPRLQTPFSGWIESSSDLAALQGYNASKEIITVTDTDDVSHEASILDLTYNRLNPALWLVSMTLLDFGLTES
jgi:hypothetical protein